MGVTDFDEETNPDTDLIDSSDEVNQHNDDEIQNEEALSDFEDMIDSSGSTDTEHSITILHFGQLMYKAAIFRLISNRVGVPKSGDRLRRVQGMSKFLTKPNPGQATDSTDIFAVRDILATVVSNSQGTNLVLLYAECLLNGKQKVTYVDRSTPGIIIWSSFTTSRRT